MDCTVILNVKISLINSFEISKYKELKMNVSHNAAPQIYHPTIDSTFSIKDLKPMPSLPSYVHPFSHQEQKIDFRDIVLDPITAQVDSIKKPSKWLTLNKIRRFNYQKWDAMRSGYTDTACQEIAIKPKVVLDQLSEKKQPTSSKDLMETSLTSHDHKFNFNSNFEYLPETDLELFRPICISDQNESNLIGFETNAEGNIIKNIDLVLSQNFHYYKKSKKIGGYKEKFNLSPMDTFNQQKNLLEKVEYLIKDKVYDISITLNQDLDVSSYTFKIELIKITNKGDFISSSQSLEQISTDSNRVVLPILLLGNNLNGDTKGIFYKIKVLIQSISSNNEPKREYKCLSNTFKLAAQNTLRSTLKERSEKLDLN